MSRTPASTRRQLLMSAGPAIATACAAGIGSRQTLTTAQSAPPTIRILVPDIALKTTVRAFREQFFVETGISASVRATPAENILFAIREDVRTGANDIDCAIVPMWHIGDLLADDLIVPLGDFFESPNNQFPEVRLDDELPAIRALRGFGDDLVAVPFDSDCMLLYYRRDLLENATHQDAFESFAGFPLRIPSTWDELESIGAYFRTVGIDAAPLHLRDGGQGMFQYLAVAGPHVIGEQNPGAFWFDSDTFEPLMASEGHIEALELFRRLYDQGPGEQIGWTLADAWQHFLQGHAVFAIAWPDLMALAIDSTSPLGDRIGIAQLPGMNTYIDPLNGGRYSTDEPNIVGNTLGAAWGGVVRASSSMKNAAYHFLAILATGQRQRTFGFGVDDGVDPGRSSQMPPEVDSGGIPGIDDYVRAGFTDTQAIEFTTAVRKTLSNPLQLPYLRIPGAFDYLSVLDRRLSEFIADPGISPETAMELVNADFRAISERLGIERQLDTYRRSLQ